MLLEATATQISVTHLYIVSFDPLAALKQAASQHVIGEHGCHLSFSLVESKNDRQPGVSAFCQTGP